MSQIKVPQLTRTKPRSLNNLLSDSVMACIGNVAKPITHNHLGVVKIYSIPLRSIEITPHPSSSNYFHCCCSYCSAMSDICNQLT